MSLFDKFKKIFSNDSKLQKEVDLYEKGLEKTRNNFL